MELLIGMVTGLAAGVQIGLWIRRGQVARKEERLSYAVPELIRRKGGALMADLRDKQGRQA